MFLVVHGFGGSLSEVEYLVDYLQGRNLDVRTVKLAGHGNTKEELKKSSYSDWIDSVKEAVEKLQKDYRYVHFLGFSMGGLLNVHFAPLLESSRIVFVNTPIYFWNVKIIIGDVINGIRYRQFDKFDYYKSSVTGTSIKSGIDFLILLMKSKKMIKNIKNNCLIAQCLNDESVHYKSAQYIKRKIGDSAKLQLYQGGCHQIFSKSPEIREQVCKDIYQFLVTK